MRSLPFTGDQIVDVVVYVTKGLVDVCEAELLELAPRAVVREGTERFILIGIPAADLEQLGALARTVDDLRLLVAGPGEVATPDALAALLELGALATRRVLEADDESDWKSGPWSVTLSARNPPWRGRLDWGEGDLIEKHLPGASLTATSRHDVDLRLQVDEKLAHISLNLWPQPIGKHAGEAAPNWKGALKPTVAAALLRLAVGPVAAGVVERGLYDPFCGSGTIVGEAFRAGLSVFASDVSPDAVKLTRSRLAGLGAEPDGLLQQVFVRDVMTGPDSRVTARVVAGNLPWGKQVEVDQRGVLFDTTALLVWHLIRSGGSAALLTTNEDQLVSRLRSRGLTVATRRIGMLGQTPAVVTACPG